ncbi:lamin tail domain-containing protein [Hymenobacter sp. DG25B]|uniref:lamin tail domain-containing protein n=1 Tax=Hymenobacter sp. DG25B TaxID=1385664 RepID=UPI0005CA71D1|nr:lamin tail domain-containing protein [Hymenobacter sp. DG25B]
MSVSLVNHVSSALAPRFAHLSLLAGLLLFLIAGAVPAQAQLSESFTDGNFVENPAWTGDVASFEVNTALQLQSNGPAVTGTSLQLVTPSLAVSGTTWEFYANLKLATSSGNLADVWLLSDQNDLRATTNHGYYVRLGGTPDEISLFRKDASTSAAYVINGRDQSLNSSNNNVVRVRVTRAANDTWTLETDLTGTGQSYTTEGTATDATYHTSNYLGIALTYSSSNSRSFYFDDFRVSDQQAPQPLTVTPTAARQLDVQFSEAVTETQLASNYQLKNSTPSVSAAVRDATDNTLVHLTLATDLPLGTNTLTVQQVADLFGNTLATPAQVEFVNSGFAVQPGVNQVLITEILADESPVVGLPASEYLEIFNPTTQVISLAGIRLLKLGSSTVAVFPAGASLQPGEYAVVCGSTRGSLFASYGKVFALSNFPSLNNSGDQLVLRARDGKTLFSVSYSDTWYKDGGKKEGGWALEMVDTTNPCAGIENWTASNDASGGTPGKANSVQATNGDHTAPVLQKAVAINATTVRLYFAEKLDSVAAANPVLYTLTGGPTITKVVVASPGFQTVDLELNTALQPSQQVTVQVQSATDCVGNAAGPATSATFALPSVAEVGDIVINEILFNPRTGGVDFVELLNRSGKYLDLQEAQLGNIMADGGLDAETISEDTYVLAPGQLLVLTTRPDIVQAHYPTHDPAAFLLMTSLPSFPDDAGQVVVKTAQGVVLDQVAYSAKQHLAVLSDVNGVSLERIRPEGPSTAANFHSAAGSVGYATPGRRNSQYQEDPNGSKLFTLEPEVFTPDGDGEKDFTTLNYTLNEPGNLASVTIYDAQGRLVRRLVRNETLATKGFVQWDGLTDQGRKATVGYYLLHIQLLQPKGGTKREYKRTVVVGARL